MTEQTRAQITNRLVAAYDSALKSLRPNTDANRKRIRKYSGQYFRFIRYTNATRAYGLPRDAKVILNLLDDFGNRRNIYAEGVELGAAAFAIACEKLKLSLTVAVSSEQEQKKNAPEKYLKLSKDVKEALKAGKSAEKKVPRDGGASNLDGTMIFLPRWNKKMVINMLYPNGGDWETYLGKSGAFFISPDTRYQGDKRSINAETVTKYLRNKGYDVFDYQQMD